MNEDKRMWIMRIQRGQMDEWMSGYKEKEQTSAEWRIVSLDVCVSEWM